MGPGIVQANSAEGWVNSVEPGIRVSSNRAQWPWQLWFLFLHLPLLRGVPWTHRSACGPGGTRVPVVSTSAHLLWVHFQICGCRNTVPFPLYVCPWSLST